MDRPEEFWPALGGFHQLPGDASWERYARLQEIVNRVQASEKDMREVQKK
jgi:hypothetical protein